MDGLKQPSVDRTDFRNAMSCVAGAVQLVATDGPAGRRGVTVTSVCSVSDMPATLLVCLNASSPLNSRFVENGVFSVNTLGTGDEALARIFAGEGKLATEERFAAASWETLTTGAPILPRALAAFDCRLIEAHAIATHRVLIGVVIAVRTGVAGPSLLYRDRRYLAL